MGRPRIRRIAVAVLAMLVIPGCSATRTLNALTPTAKFVAERGVAYGDHPRQRLDVYAPGGVDAAPVIVFFYGGRWSDGERGDYAWLGAALAAEGIVTVIADYRLYPEVRFPAFVEDGAAAVHWTKAGIAQFGGDADRLFVMGHSSGAHIALMLALDRQYLAADSGDTGLAGVIGLAGPYDFLPLEADDLKDMFGPPARYPDSQPIEFARGDAPPLLLAHGRADEVVSPDNSESLASAVRDAGGVVESRFYRGVNHTRIVGALSGWLRFIAPVRADLVGFVRRPAASADEPQN